MKRTDQATALLLFLGSVAYSATALLQYEYTAKEGPGAAFLPFWLGGVMAVMAVLLFVNSTRGQYPPGSWLPRGQGLRRILAVLVSTVILVALLNVIGMITGVALFLVFIVRFVERHSWRATLGVAVGCAGGFWLLFGYWLSVPFPVGPLGF